MLACLFQENLWQKKAKKNVLLFERICFCSFSRVEGNDARSAPPSFECNKRHSKLLSRASLSSGSQWNGFEVGSILRMKLARYQSNLLIVLFR